MNFSQPTDVITEENELNIDEKRSPAYIAAGATFFILIFTCSFFGNLGIVYLFTVDKQLRKYESSKLVINLSVTDLLTALLVVLFSCVSLISDEWPFGSIWCEFQCAFNYCLIIVSMLTLSFISLDRYYAVQYPLNYSTKINNRKIKIGLSVAWFQGITFAAVPYAGNWIVYDYWEIVCAINWNSSSFEPLTYVIVAFVFCFTIPGIVMLYCYSKACQTIFFDQKVIAANNSTLKREYKVLVSFLIVCAGFFICMTPFCVTKVIKITSSETRIPGWVSTVATFLQFSSSAMNPFIYGILRKDVQKAFKRQLRKFVQNKKNKNSVGPDNRTHSTTISS